MSARWKKLIICMCTSESRYSGFHNTTMKSKILSVKKMSLDLNKAKKIAY